MKAHITVVLVGAVGVTVEGAGLPVCGPACVSQAEVCVQLLIQVQQVFLWMSKTQTPLPLQSKTNQNEHNFNRRISLRNTNFAFSGS